MFFEHETLIIESGALYSEHHAPIVSQILKCITYLIELPKPIYIFFFLHFFLSSILILKFSY